MNNRKSDILIFSISILLNLFFLFIMPSIKVEEIKNKKLKVGLTSIATNNKQVQPPKKEVPKKENAKKEIGKPKPKPVAVAPEKPKEIKPEPPKVEEVKEVVKEVKRPSLDDLSKAISRREEEILTTNNTDSKRIVDAIKQDHFNNKLQNKELIANNRVSEPKVTHPKNSSDINLTDDLDVEELELEELRVNEEESIEELEIVTKDDGVEGLPSGYKLGVEDGEIVARWDENNKEPKYPKSAQLRGMQGTVLLRIQIDERGKLTSVFLEKGSGVPEINEAIEKIARTWRIYLNKNGLNIKGEVTLEYNFKLLGSTE